MVYAPRDIDPLLKDLVSGLPAVSLEGAKGVGKTATALQLAASTIELDQTGYRNNVDSDPQIVTTFPAPTLIDEWQLVPAVWDVVRRAVDQDRTPGRFLLTGSATPNDKARLHSGAGRIVRLVMRPMTLPERGTDARFNFSTGGWQVGNWGGKPARATFIPLSKDPDSENDIYGYNWYFTNTVWTKQ